VEHRSGILWAAILASWVVATVLLASRLLAHAASATTIPLIVLVLLALSFFVLVGFFNIAVNVASRILREKPATQPPRGTPRVAVLYCTMNDFVLPSAETLLRLSYPRVDLWILDDSSEPRARDRVDAFVRDAAVPGRPVHLVRRNLRRGYKAGAINNVLGVLPRDVEYVAIVDADERLPAGFIQDCLPYFSAPDIAFVQANHYCVNTDEGWFTRYLGVGVDLHWRHYQRYRNRYGTVNMLGHGAVVRRDVLEELGGFPEVTCEDLAFTATARGAGYRGVFAFDVLCGETFPSTFSAMRKRHLRWCAGTVEFLRHYAVAFARSPARLHEKLDLLLPSLNLPSALLLLGFVLAVQGLWRAGEVTLLTDPVLLTLGVLAGAAPLCVFADLFRRPGFAIKTIAINTFAYLALFPLSVVGVLRGLVRPAQFVVTPKGPGWSQGVGATLKESVVDMAFGVGLLSLGYQIGGTVGLLSPLALASLASPALILASGRRTTGLSTARSPRAIGPPEDPP